MTILNGTQGVNEVLTGIISQGLIILDVLKRSTAALTGTDGTAVNGDEPEPPYGSRQAPCVNGVGFPHHVRKTDADHDRALRAGVAVEELVDVGIVDAGEDAGRQRGQHV